MADRLILLYLGLSEADKQRVHAAIKAERDHMPLPAPPEPADEGMLRLYMKEFI